MKRYHKKIYFPDTEKLQNLNIRLNALAWRYSEHCLDNIKYRSLNLKRVLSFISELELKSQDIFEYYRLNDDIIKVCYRIKYNDNIDIILVISQDKKIITIYYNSADDEHFTLRKNLYCTA